MIDLTIKVKSRIDEYLGFNSDILFKNCDYLEIFGGAVRDSIADMEIHDVDILSVSKSAKKCGEILEHYGYKMMLELNGKEIQDMYREIHCIYEPWTFINNDLKIVQIIRPAGTFENQKFDDHLMTYFNPTSFFNTMKQVDLSCCGVSYNGNIVKENCTNAIVHCMNHYYFTNETAKMYKLERTTARQSKLNNRGWTNIEYLNDEQKINLDRFIKLDYILND
jgi:hypothetical protein